MVLKPIDQKWWQESSFRRSPEPLEEATSVLGVHSIEYWTKAISWLCTSLALPLTQKCVLNFSQPYTRPQHRDVPGDGKPRFIDFTTQSATPDQQHLLIVFKPQSWMVNGYQCHCPYLTKNHLDWIIFVLLRPQPYLARQDRQSTERVMSWNITKTLVVDLNTKDVDDRKYGSKLDDFKIKYNQPTF